MSREPDTIPLGLLLVNRLPYVFSLHRG